MNKVADLIKQETRERERERKIVIYLPNYKVAPGS